mgnify:CR=1 FL=1
MLLEILNFLFRLLLTFYQLCIHGLLDLVGPGEKGRHPPFPVRAAFKKRKRIRPLWTASNTPGGQQLLPLLRQFNIRFYVYNPLAGGLLSGKYTSSGDAPIADTRFDGKSVAGKRYQARYWKDCYFEAIEKIQKSAAELAPGKTLPEISLTWLHHHSGLKRDAFDAIIVGQSSASHLHTNLYSGTQGSEADNLLPEALLKVIDEAWELVKPECAPYNR